MGQFKSSAITLLFRWHNTSMFEGTKPERACIVLACSLPRTPRLATPSHLTRLAQTQSSSLMLLFEKSLSRLYSSWSLERCLLSLLLPVTLLDSGYSSASCSSASSSESGASRGCPLKSRAAPSFIIYIASPISASRIMSPVSILT